MADAERYVFAQSATSVWVAGRDSNNDVVLIHWNGKGWTRVPTDAPGSSLPWVIASDGRGGINMTGYDLVTYQCFVLHRSASGTWTRTVLHGGMSSLVPVPGTSSSWGAGTQSTPPLPPP
jgi:hypothetical protein